MYIVSYYVVFIIASGTNGISGDRIMQLSYWVQTYVPMVVGSGAVLVLAELVKVTTPKIVQCNNTTIKIQYWLGIKIKVKNMA